MKAKLYINRQNLSGNNTKGERYKKAWKKASLDNKYI